MAQAERNALVLRLVFIAAGLLMLFMLYRTSQALRATLGGAVDEVHAQITRLGRGDFSAPIVLAPGQQGTVMAHLADTQL